MRGLRLGLTGAADAGLAETLRERGARITDGCGDAPAGGPENLLGPATAGRLDALVVADPGAAEALVREARGAGAHADLLEAVRGPVVVAVPDPETARALERSGIPVGIMPPEPRTASLIRALDAWAARQADGLAPGLVDRRWPVELCPDARVARIGTGSVVLGELEFRVLAAMVRRPGVTCRHALLLREAWGPERPDDPTRVKHQISRIRQKLGPARDCIETVRAVGYRYAPGRDDSPTPGAR